MKKLILTAAVLLSAVALCNAKSPIKGSGVSKNDARTVDSYTSINVANGIALNFSKDQIAGVVVRADDNLMDYIETQVIGGELVIRFKTGEDIKTKTDPVVTVPQNVSLSALTVAAGSKVMGKEQLEVNNLRIKAMGNAQFDLKIDIKQTLQLELTGGAKCELNGSASELNLVMQGGSKFDGYNLKTKNVVCELAGGSNAKITCNGRLDVNELSGNSDLSFKGNCEIGKVVMKSGSTISCK